MVTLIHTHSCWIKVLQLLAPGMNVYGPASPFIAQDLAQGTMCTPQGNDDALAFNLLDSSWILIV